MRFGVFVDLWSKSEAASVEVENDRTEPRSTGTRAPRGQSQPSSPRADPSERRLPSQAQMGMLHALLRGQGIESDDDKHGYAKATLGREVASLSDLSQADISKLIDKLKADAA